MLSRLKSWNNEKSILEEKCFLSCNDFIFSAHKVIIIFVKYII